MLQQELNEFDELLEQNELNRAHQAGEKSSASTSVETEINKNKQKPDRGKISMVVLVQIPQFWCS